MAEIRVGGRFVFGRFQYVGPITATGTTVVLLVSLGIVRWFWPDKYEDLGFALAELITDELNPFDRGAVFVTT